MLKSKSKFFKLAIVLPVAMAVSACEMPREREHRGAVIGGAAGAAAGAIIAREHRVVGAVLGGLLGAGAGYVIGAETGRIRTDDQEAAAEAAVQAQQNPATPEEARRATTADINQDGFVTLDEVVAMSEAGFSDDEMIRRMEATDQVFELTPEQEQYLLQREVGQNVIERMRQINRDLLIEDRRDVIGDPRPF